MKRLIKLIVAVGVATATLSACIVVPAGPPHHYHRSYYGPGPGPYYGR